LFVATFQALYFLFTKGLLTHLESKLFEPERDLLAAALG
jgi:hypothetical protein